MSVFPLGIIYVHKKERIVIIRVTKNHKQTKGNKFEIETKAIYDWIEFVNDSVDDLELYEDMK